MTDAYMDWSSDTVEDGLGKLYTHPEDAVIEGMQRVYVVDIFSKFFFCFCASSSNESQLLIMLMSRWSRAPSISRPHMCDRA